MARTFNFSRRPFRDERPVLFSLAAAFALAVLLLAANLRQWVGFHREIEGTARQIESLDARRERASRGAEESRAALNNYKVSTLAQESRGLLKLVAERRFSWSGLLARLERTLPSDVRVIRLSPRFDENGATSLDISLIGRAPDAIVRTIAALSRDPLFGAVDLRSESTPEGGAPEGYSFELQLRYRTPDASNAPAAVDPRPLGRAR
ncbi:MAG: hypothetical protein ABI592_02360 [Acidobacteriota bacterium]